MREGWEIHCSELMFRPGVWRVRVLLRVRSGRPI